MRDVVHRFHSAPPERQPSRSASDGNHPAPRWRSGSEPCFASISIQTPTNYPFLTRRSRDVSALGQEGNPVLQARRRFASAGELLAGFANSFVFEFTGGDANLSASLANFTFIQPLLRGAGKDIALEQLTFTERKRREQVYRQAVCGIMRSRKGAVDSRLLFFHVGVGVNN